MAEEQNLISIDDLIKRAKKEGVDFGKADPYNRLRYYTKISLLPHMERRKTKTGELKAYYPEDALEKLIKIETLKEQGLSNEEILVSFQKEGRSLKKAFVQYLTGRNIAIAFAALVFVVVLLSSKGIITLSKDTNPGNPLSQNGQSEKILDSGTGTLKAGRNSTFVRSSYVTSLSQIQVSFKDTISPATTYYIESKVPEEGFVLTLDNFPSSDSNFSWWVTEN